MTDKTQWLAPLFKITHRIVVFFTIFQFVLFALYLAGNRNLFLDSTLIGILALNTITSIILLVLSVIYFAQILVCVITTRRLSYLWYMCVFVAAAASGAALAVVTRALARFAAQ
jgi:hypothetical protein